MICYIKSFKDFRTIAKYDAVSYSLADGEDGHITIYEKDPVQLMTKYVGCWLIIGDGKINYKSNPYTFSTEVDESGGIVLNIFGSGLNVHENQLATGGREYNISARTMANSQYVYYISECSPADDSLDLTIKHPIYAFERAVLYDGTKTYGNLIKNILDNNFGINCPDSEYAMLYMNVISSDETECSIETDQFGYIVPCDIFEEARKNGVIINFVNTPNNTLEVSINSSDYEHGYIVFGDGHSIIQSESYDASFCAKATILQEFNDQSNILAQSELTNARQGVKFLIQVCEDIKTTKAIGKIRLQARAYVEWPETQAEESVKYSNNRFDIVLGNSWDDNKVLLSVEPEWDRTPEAGNHFTEWYDLKDIDNIDSCNLYSVIRMDGLPYQTDGDNKYVSLSLPDLIKSSAIKEGPLQEEYTEEHGTYYRVLDYYLTKDKEIVQEPPLVRPHGAWNIYQANSNESPLMIATGAFSGNSDNHKIEFYSDKKFEYYQPMILRLRGEILETIITSRVLSRNDGRYFYKCGNLMTTLTDHVRGLEEKSKWK